MIVCIRFHDNSSSCDDILLWTNVLRPELVYLLSNVLWLSLYSHSGDARQVNERQVWNVRRGDLQTDELITDPHPDPGHFILSWRETA